MISVVFGGPLPRTNWPQLSLRSPPRRRRRAWQCRWHGPRLASPPPRPLPAPPGAPWFRRACRPPGRPRQHRRHDRPQSAPLLPAAPGPTAYTSRSSAARHSQKLRRRRRSCSAREASARPAASHQAQPELQALPGIAVRERGRRSLPPRRPRQPWTARSKPVPGKATACTDPWACVSCSC